MPTRYECALMLDHAVSSSYASKDEPKGCRHDRRRQAAFEPSQFTSRIFRTQQTMPMEIPENAEFE